VESSSKGSVKAKSGRKAASVAQSEETTNSIPQDLDPGAIGQEVVITPAEQLPASTDLNDQTETELVTKRDDGGIIDNALVEMEDGDIASADAGGGDDVEGGGGSDGAGDGERKTKKKKGAISRELKAKMRGEDPKSKILCVMYKRNRPGNATTVEGFTGHKIPKGIVQNTLEELSKSGELTCKEGKAGKVYWFTQTQFKTKGLNITKLRKAVDEHTEELARLQEEHGTLAKSLRQLEATPADEDLDRLLDEVTSRRDALKVRVETLRATTLDVTPQQREKKKKEFTALRGEWTKRKRWCAEAVGSLADSCDKKPADMAKVIGIETDEDSNAILPPVIGTGFGKGRPIVRLGGSSTSGVLRLGKSVAKKKSR